MSMLIYLVLLKLRNYLVVDGPDLLSALSMVKGTRRDVEAGCAGSHYQHFRNSHVGVGEAQDIGRKGKGREHGSEGNAVAIGSLVVIDIVASLVRMHVSQLAQDSVQSAGMGEK